MATTVFKCALVCICVAPAYVQGGSGGGLGHSLPFKVLSNNSDLEYFRNFIENVRQERDFNALYIAYSASVPNMDEPRIAYLMEMQIPKIISKEDGLIDIKPNFSDEILTICIFNEGFTKRSLLSITQNIYLMHHVRVLILGLQIQNEANFLKAMLDWCSDEKIPNVLVHFISYYNSSHQDIYYQVKPYPNYRYATKSFNTSGSSGSSGSSETQKIYPKHWQDMQGKVLYTLPDQIEPRSLVYKDSKGKDIISGYLGKLLLTFAHKHNATLKFPFPVKQGEIIHMAKIANLTRRGVIDIGMSLYYTYTSSKWQHMSYPVELTKWYVIVPCPHPIPISETFGVVLSLELNISIIAMVLILSVVHTLLDAFYTQRIDWIAFIINIKVFPAILGQGISLPNSIETALKFIYTGVFLLGLFITNLFSAELKTLIITPIYSANIKTFQDIRDAHLKILLDISDKSAIDSFSTPEFQAKIHGIVQYTEDTEAYHKYLKQFNTSYSYTVTLGLWNILQEQQSYYVHPIFCAHSQLYIVDTLLMAIPLTVNSPYKEPLNDFLSAVYANGLMGAWQADTFHDMLQKGNIFLKDKSDEIVHLPLNMKDLRQIWVILTFGLFVSFIILLLELLVSKSSCK